jgi:hypothetical protein
MKYLSIVLATLLLASCSTTGMSSGDGASRGGGASGVNNLGGDCSTNPPGLYCGD